MLYLSGEECAHLCSCLKHCAADLLHYANTTQTPISPPPTTPSKSDLYRKREKRFESLNMSVRVCLGTSGEGFDSVAQQGMQPTAQGRAS